MKEKRQRKLLLIEETLGFFPYYLHPLEDELR
jgi:hypothetical protein